MYEAYTQMKARSSIRMCINKRFLFKYHIGKQGGEPVHILLMLGGMQGVYNKRKPTDIILERSLNPIQGEFWADNSGGGGKNACATYFGHISSMEARIFMKVKTYVH